MAVANGENLGSVYLFSRLSKGKVTQIARLSASDGVGLFAVAVGENGGLVVAGAPTETIGHNAKQGAVYVFVKPEGGWTGDIMETAKLTASDGRANDLLGLSVLRPPMGSLPPEQVKAATMVRARAMSTSNLKEAGLAGQDGATHGIPRGTWR